MIPVIIIKLVPTSVALLDACPTGDLNVEGSTLARSATFFCGNNYEMFSTVILSLFPDSRRAVVSFWRKNVHKYWLIS